MQRSSLCTNYYIVCMKVHKYIIIILLLLHVDTSFDSSHEILVLDVLVIIISILFIYLSVRSLYKTFRLACRITRFLMPRLIDFHLKILCPLFSIWHMLVIASNLLAVVGSLFKLLLSTNVSISI